MEIFRFGEIPQWSWTPFWLNFAIGDWMPFGSDAVQRDFPLSPSWNFALWLDPARSGIIPLGRLTEQNVWVFLAIGETPPSRRAMFRSAESGPFDTVSSRQQTTLQPNPTDRKPTLEAERQGLGCSEPGTFWPFRPRRFRRQHSKFRTFFGNFKPFRHFFAIFFAVGRNFPRNGENCRAFRREDCKTLRIGPASVADIAVP